MPTIEEVKKIPPKTLLKIINRAKKYLKQNQVVNDMFKEYNVDINIIDLIPIKFGDLEVSARTDHGIITLNYKLLCDGDFFNNYQYLTHEFCHILQQCYGDKPTKGASDGEYLDNSYEREGFVNQIKYIDDQFGKNKAENYVDNLLDHHDIKDENKREELETVFLEEI